MELNMVRGDNAAVVVGGTWVVEFFTSEDGYTEAADPTLVVTLPNGTTISPDFESESDTGLYEYHVPITLPGRYVASIAAAELDGLRYVSCFALEVTTDNEMPNVADVVVYLEGGKKTTSFDPDVIETFLASESAAQRSRCRIPAAYPPDLRMALLRRVQRAMAMKGIVYDGQTGPDGDSYTPTNDPEIRRLEAPYRKVLLG